ncbi:MAG: HAD family hydrolase, partial [Acidimicrobiales bacterium]
EAGVVVDDVVLRRLSSAHADALGRQSAPVGVLPGAEPLLAELSRIGLPWAVTTNGTLRLACPALELLGVPDAVLVCGDEVRRAPRAPRTLDLVLVAAARLHVLPASCVVVGDSVWDLLAARRAGAGAIGVLSGGYGREELERAGASRVFDDANDLLAHLGEVGIRPPG